MLNFATDTAEQIILYCEKEGFKRSYNRVLIAEKLYEAADFVDAENLWLKLGPEKKVSLATTYLVLHWLVVNGFAEKKLCGKRMFVYRLK
jgi:Fe2+ or Zn2+ uptake regulation protein